MQLCFFKLLIHLATTSSPTKGMNQSSDRQQITRSTTKLRDINRKPVVPNHGNTSTHCTETEWLTYVSPDPDHAPFREDFFIGRVGLGDKSINAPNLKSILCIKEALFISILVLCKSKNLTCGEFDLWGIHRCFLPLLDISLGLKTLSIYISYWVLHLQDWYSAQIGWLPFTIRYEMLF